MNRREFLKALGLGGVALTVPLSRKLMAASMADLKAPPFHVGVTEMGPLSNGDQRFHMVGLSLHSDFLDGEKWSDLYSKWMVGVSFKREGERGPGTLWLQQPASMLAPSITNDFVMVADVPRGNLLRPYADEPPYFYDWAPGDIAKFWIVPGSMQDLPKFPLPDLSIHVHGWIECRPTPTKRAESKRTVTFWATFRRVSLDRAQAIKLRLVDPKVELFKELMEG